MTGQVETEPLAGGRGEAEPSVPVRGGVRKEGFKGRAAVLGDRNPGCSGSTARLLGEERAGESHKDTACLKGRGILGIMMDERMSIQSLACSRSSASPSPPARGKCLVWALKVRSSQKGGLRHSCDLPSSPTHPGFPQLQNGGRHQAKSCLGSVDAKNQLYPS